MQAVLHSTIQKLRRAQRYLADATAAAADCPATPSLQGYPFTACPVGAPARSRR